MNKIPTVKVFKNKDQKSYIFWCSSCNTFHTHGASALSHRIEHRTNKNSPYYKTGYFLKEYTKREILELGLPIN